MWAFYGGEGFVIITDVPITEENRDTIQVIERVPVIWEGETDEDDYGMGDAAKATHEAGWYMLTEWKLNTSVFDIAPNYEAEVVQMARLGSSAGRSAGNRTGRRARRRASIEERDQTGRMVNVEDWSPAQIDDTASQRRIALASFEWMLLSLGVLLIATMYTALVLIGFGLLGLYGALVSRRSS